MTILITLTTVGIDCSTFDIYSDIDGFISAFETDVLKASLSTGFSSANVPDGTTVIRVKAKGVCTNYIDLNLDGSTTTTTTSSSSTSTTTTTTTTVAPSIYVKLNQSSIDYQTLNIICDGLSTLSGSKSTSTYSVSFFSDSLGTIPLSVTNLTINYRTTSLDNLTSVTTTTDESITFSGTSGDIFVNFINELTEADCYNNTINSISANISLLSGSYTII